MAGLFTGVVWGHTALELCPKCLVYIHLRSVCIFSNFREIFRKVFSGLLLHSNYRLPVSDI